jgi:hypothetical protein
MRCRSFRNRRIGWDLDSFCSIMADSYLIALRNIELQQQADCIRFGWD